MSTRPVLRLGPHQWGQLIAYGVVYRSYLWQQVLPTPERNQEVRRMQALLGRLKTAVQGQADGALYLDDEEVSTLKQLFAGVMRYYAAEPASARRIQQLAELTTLRVFVERMLR